MRRPPRLQQLDRGHRPFLFRPDYVFELPDRDAEALGMQEPTDALMRCILTLNDDAEKITANLLAPLVLCRRTHMARQVILQDQDLELRAPIFADAPVTEQEQPTQLRASA
jgi:flagellar assembly factor FliW